MGLKLVCFGACTILALSISMLIIGYNSHKKILLVPYTLLCDEAPLYLLATGSTLTGITILLIVLYFLQRRLKYYHEKVGVSFGQKLMPGEAWGEELYWLSKDVKRWRIIIGVFLCICCFAQFCIHLWGSIKIFGKLFLQETSKRHLCALSISLDQPSKNQLRDSGLYFYFWSQSKRERTA